MRPNKTQAIWSLVLVVTLAFAVQVESQVSPGLYLPKGSENSMVTFEKFVTEPDGIHYVPHGAGFLLGYKSSVYLVTNRHVLEHRDSIAVRFNMPTDSGAVGRRLVCYLVRGGKRIWFAHPDTSVDLAIIEAPPDLKFSVLDEGRLKMMKEIHLGDPVLFLGYPIQTESDMNFPIVRSGIVAFKTIRGLQFNGPNGFTIDPSTILLDAVVLPGNSGSPVLSTYKEGGDRVTLIGVLSSHLAEIRSAPFEGAGEKSLDLGVCIPSDRVVEVIDAFIGAQQLKQK
jgi:S1-C subfamily serine protease